MGKRRRQAAVAPAPEPTAAVTMDGGGTAAEICGSGLFYFIRIIIFQLSIYTAQTILLYRVFTRYIRLTAESVL